MKIKDAYAVQGPSYNAKGATQFDYYVEAVAQDGQRITHKHAFAWDQIDRAAVFADKIRRCGVIDPQHWVSGGAWEQFASEVA